MTYLNARLHALWCFAFAVIYTLPGCSLLSPPEAPKSTYYSLDAPPALAPATKPVTPITLIINPPRAAAGFDSHRIIYVREPYKLQYFAQSEWIDPPARMLGALLVTAIERSGSFGAVVLSAGSASGDLRLDTEIVRLQHEFQTTPSVVRFTLKATLVDDKSRRVLAGRVFEATVPTASEDPYGGVVAANQAVQAVLKDLALFLTERPK
jgi:cholesterol transport system auxiliary component